ncbi:MAG: wax ester/triacylglycerol synthase domain-containing protein [Gammaproteobacteria bacterium]
MRLIRPADDFMILGETDASPIHIAALQIYDVPDERRAGFCRAVREHFARRLPATPLLCVRRGAPFGYDSDQWLDVDRCDLEYHVVEVDDGAPMAHAALTAFVEASTMQRLDPARPPFRAYAINRLADGGSALFLKVPHAFTDGIGFQSLVRLLTDPGPVPEYPPLARRAERPDPAPLWMLRSALRFRREAPLREARARARQEAERALEALRKDPAKKRARAPMIERFSGPTSARRSYEFTSLPLARFKDLGRALGGTVNDAFLTVAGGAMRNYLISIGALPDAPLVINSARSYRRPEHGDYGNRITAIRPHIGTHIADPIERLAAIRASMAVELERSRHDEILVDRDEIPFGPRKRRQRLAERTETGQRVLPGDLTLSNVPGPAEARWLAGYRQAGNYPAPILENGRFLNVTMRRNADMLDFGIMCDAAKLPEAARIRDCLLQSLEECERAAVAHAAAGPRGLQA